MARTITITRGAQSIVTLPGQNQNTTLGYQVTITASGAVNMPNEIFRMNQRPINPANPNGPLVNDFQGICTPLDLTSLPVGTPITGQTLFRMASVTIAYATENLAETAWLQIQADVQTLKSALDAGDNLNTIQTFTPV